jgi:luciferase-type oxidoreductase
MGCIERIVDMVDDETVQTIRKSIESRTLIRYWATRGLHGRPRMTLDVAYGLSFPRINRAYNTVSQPNKLSLGLVMPIEAYQVGAEPGLEHNLERARLAETLGFSALWLRVVPLNVPSFGDVGQIFDPFVHLGMLASVTDEIALSTASIILPLRHTAHVAKAAASTDQFSDGRILLGVASGDRPEEYPALNMTFPD